MYDVIVIGGGPAGMAAACAAHDSGLRNILIIERDVELGGILNQCIHNGFGLRYFKEELTGPEYASRFIEKVNRKGIQVMLDTMVLDLSTEEASDGRGPLRKFVTVVGRETGYRKLEAKSVILAMGCRERTRGAINTPGMRPAGVLTAGAAQRYVNVDGYMPGKKVVILGSGDIGLIMARRMTLEGAKVLACVEVMPYCGGLARNVVQCLDDFGIPLYLSHTVTDIKGRDRIEQVVVSKVDENMKPIPGTEMYFDCDTLLLSVGLIPENELSLKAGIKVDPKSNGTVVHENMETTVEGFFACGNVAHVHDLVDNVTREAERAGRSAAEYVLTNYYTMWLNNQNCDGCGLSTYIRKQGDIVHFLPPSPDGAAFKMGKNEFICTVCPRGCHLKVEPEKDYKVTGNGCPKGKAYGKAEMTNPTRVVTTTVRLRRKPLEEGSLSAAQDSTLYDFRVPVKTTRPIPKTEIMNLMRFIDDIELDERPEIGTVIARDVLGLDAGIIVTKG